MSVRLFNRQVVLKTWPLPWRETLWCVAVTLMADSLTGLVLVNERGINSNAPTVERILLRTNHEVKILLQYTKL